jgi:transmembrane sensor
MDPSASANVPTDEQLDRYLAGRATPDEEEVIHAYLVSGHPNAERLLKQPSVVHVDPAEPAASDVRTMWANVVTRIAKESVQPETQRASRAQIFTRQWATHWNGITAAVLIAVISVGSYSLLRMSERHRTNESAAAEMRTVVTQLGQQAKFRFPDGSSVVLAPGSMLRYASTFGHGVRDVELRGEALFTVTRDEGAPFIVRTGTSAVRVLGTTFDVRKFPIDTVTHVVVAQGKVSITDHVLTSGDAASMDTAGNIQVSHGVDIASALAWTTGTLVFQRASLRTVVPELERWYGVHITVLDPRLLDQQLTMTFLVRSPGDAFNSLSVLLHARVIRDGDRVVIGREE